MSIDQALEMARCVEINLGNMKKMMPTMTLHPLLPLVEDQLKSCIKELEEVIDQE